ncbi:hypothetical protein AN958_08506 [Leucoagaricus sp. SymC.cos]|nr:hypothetical protein AN958_08506 [Leucoagaricus sp. SymC.cos]
MLEKSSGLPANYYRERPYRMTIDTIYHLVDRIKEALKKELVASVLYLDIEGAFLNAVTDRLIHNIYKKRVLPTYVY